jgi:hypothetical protein
MYFWLRDHIYNGRSPVGLYWICFLPFPAIVVGGMIVSVRVDLRANREYEEGKLVRGVRLVSPAEYATESKQSKGLGLSVSGSELET